MRKAAGLTKRGSRKKQPAPNGAGPAEPKDERPSYSAVVVEQPPPEMMMPRRRQPTVEEQALTQKNYRLAKELVRFEQSE